MRTTTPDHQMEGGQVAPESAPSGIPSTTAGYVQNFADGPGGWVGWRRQGVNVPLEIRGGAARFEGPYGVDTYHAPHYLSLVTYLHTREALGLDLGRPNTFVSGGFSRDLRNATVTLRVRGNLRQRGAELTLLVQADTGGTRPNYILVGQHFTITPDWSDQQVTLPPDPSQWLCLLPRHDRADIYGWAPIGDVLADVNVDLIVALHPLTVVPATPTDEVHRLRADEDYPLDERHLPHGVIEIAEIRIDYPVR